MGRVSWAHGKANSHSHQQISSDAGAHSSVTPSYSGDLGNQSQISMAISDLTSYIGDEHTYIGDEDETRTQSTERGIRSEDSSFRQTSHAPEGNIERMSGSNFTSIYTPPTSVTSDAITVMHDPHDDEGGADPASQLLWPRYEQFDLDIIGAWLPARFDRPADIPQSLHEMTIAGTGEEPGSSSIQDILNIVERHRDEMFAERFRRTVQA